MMRQYTANMLGKANNIEYMLEFSTMLVLEKRDIVPYLCMNYKRR